MNYTPSHSPGSGVHSESAVWYSEHDPEQNISAIHGSILSECSQALQVNWPAIFTYIGVVFFGVQACICQSHGAWMFCCSACAHELSRPTLTQPRETGTREPGGRGMPRRGSPGITHLEDGEKRLGKARYPVKNGLAVRDTPQKRVFKLNVFNGSTSKWIHYHSLRREGPLVHSEKGCPSL